MNIIEPGSGPVVDGGELEPSGYATYKCKGCGMETSVRPDTSHHDLDPDCGGAFVRESHLLTGLNPTAIATLAVAGITPQQWIDASSYGYIWPAGETPTWTGDRCGCTDDRCIGFHHLGEDDCGCLTVLIDQYLSNNGKLW